MGVGPGWIGRGVCALVRRQSDGSAPLPRDALGGAHITDIFPMHLGAQVRAGSLLQSRDSALGGVSLRARVLVTSGEPGAWRLEASAEASSPRPGCGPMARGLPGQKRGCPSPALSAAFTRASAQPRAALEQACAGSRWAGAVWSARSGTGIQRLGAGLLAIRRWLPAAATCVHHVAFGTL